MQTWRRARSAVLLAAASLIAVACSSGTASTATVATLVTRASAIAEAGVNPTRPFSATGPWNTPTPPSTKWFDTSVLHQLAAPISNGDQRRHFWIAQEAKVVYAIATDPVWTFNMPDFIDTNFHRNRPAATFTMHAPDTLAPSSGSDHILTVVDGRTYVDVWLAEVDAAKHTVTGTGWATGDIVDGPGAGSSDNNDGSRAANFSWIAGQISGYDLQAGVIDHALVVSLPPDMLDGVSNKFVPPATAPDNGGATGPIVMGSRIGVPAGLAAPAGLSPLGRMIFDALQKYGAFVGDFSGPDKIVFYGDGASIAPTQLDTLFAYWDHGGPVSGSADLDKIQPLLRIADYRP